MIGPCLWARDHVGAIQQLTDQKSGEDIRGDPTTGCCPHRRGRGCNGEERSMYPGQAKPKEGGRGQPMRVHEAVTEKKSDTRGAPYALRKSQPKSKAKDDLPFRPKFRMNYRELLAILGMADKMRFPPKFDRNFGPRKELWCEFHKVFRHDVEHCIALGYQLAGLIKDGFLKEYLEGSQEGSKEKLPPVDQRHEMPVHGEINTISGGFSGGGCLTSKRKKYARAVMTVKVREPDQPAEPC